MKITRGTIPAQLWAFLLLLGFTHNVFATADPGKITGKLTDKKTGEALIGVTVLVQGTSLGAVTDVEGRYVIAIAPGTYTLDYKYMGYQTKSISGVIVKAGAVTNLDIVMDEPQSKELKEVVIRGSFKQETLASLYAFQKNNASVSDGISSEVIKKSPDRNTGEVLKRVSGASIQDNKFVIVRGLSDRYNSTLVNNAPLPSSEPDRKAFSFDIVPSNLIDQIVINKTATPDLPGDFSGGIVMMKTKDFPTTRTMELSYGIGYNTISTFKDFYGSKKGGLDYLGFDDGLRKLPSSFPSTREEYVSMPRDQRLAISKDFKNTWGIEKRGTVMPSQNAQFVYGNSYDLKNDYRFGTMLSLSYRNSATINEQVRNDFNEIDYVNTGKGIPLFEYNDRIYRFNTSVGALANFAISRKNSKIAWKNIFNQTFDDSYIDRSGIFDQDYVQRNLQFEVSQKSLINTLLEGEHRLGPNNAKLTWDLSYSRTKREQPDLRRLYYEKTVEDAENEAVPFRASVPLVATSSTAGRFYSDLTENMYAGAINYQQPFKIAGQTQSFKVGLWKQYRQRDFSARIMGYIRADYTQFNTDLLTLPADQIFAPENMGPTGFIMDEITEPRNKYDASGDLSAGYIMFNNEMWSKLKLAWGVRFENYSEKLNTRLNTGPLGIRNEYNDFLPSLNASYAVTDKANIRASYSRTVARAEFRELAPFSFYNFETGIVMIGNPDLKRTRIDNLDLRYEFFPASGQIISVSAFYKRLDKPIELFVNSGSTAASKTMSYINAPEATVYGGEMEIRENLGFINNTSKVLNALTAYVNFALIKSEVDFSALDLATIKNQRPLQGQSPYLINGGLQYANANNDFLVNVLYNRIGRRLSVVGFGQYVEGKFQADYPDIYEAPRDLIDLQISKKIIRNKGEIKLNVRDLLNQRLNFYQDLNDNKRYDKANDQLINSVRFGTNVTLSFGYKF